MLKKMVNGIEVECTPEEEKEIREEWKKNAFIYLQEKAKIEEKQNLRKEFKQYLKSVSEKEKLTQNELQETVIKIAKLLGDD
jgi:chemotaxis regulatin CheY-phosphate phosphatase CheZ